MHSLNIINIPSCVHTIGKFVSPHCKFTGAAIASFNLFLSSNKINDSSQKAGSLTGTCKVGSQRATCKKKTTKLILWRKPSELGRDWKLYSHVGSDGIRTQVAAVEVEERNPFTNLLGHVGYHACTVCAY